MPMRRRRLWTFLRLKMFVPSMAMLPLDEAPGISSIVLLIVFSRVVFPEFAGPMMPKISLRGMERVMFSRAFFPPYATVRS